MEAMEAGDSGSRGKSNIVNNVNLATAYVLYFLGGVFGLHHAYLNRPQQALGWYASFGLFGWGLVRDFFRLPQYVALARDDRARNATARVRAATVAARDGVPRLSLARIFLMWLFGIYFSTLASCLVCLPEAEDGAEAGGVWWTGFAYGTLNALGTAVGVWLVGNMGEETILASPDSSGGLVDFAHLAAWCLGSFALTRHAVIGGLIYAVRHRRYRPSMFPLAGKGTGAPPGSAPRRLGRHLSVCAIYTALLSLAAYNHGHVTVGVESMRKIYLHEALRNAYHSEFWKDFEWTEFREGVGAGGAEGGEYLKHMFDVQGERGARRLLGVGRDAPHSEVRKAYKKLALKYHPDKVGANATEREVEETKRQFRKVQEAYDILNDVEQARKKKEAAKAGSQQHRRGERSEWDEM